MYLHNHISFCPDATLKTGFAALISQMGKPEAQRGFPAHTFFPLGGSLPEVLQNFSEEGQPSQRENLDFCGGSFLLALCKAHSRHKVRVVKK